MRRMRPKCQPRRGLQYDDRPPVLDTRPAVHLFLYDQGGGDTRVGEQGYVATVDREGGGERHGIVFLSPVSTTANALNLTD